MIAAVLAVWECPSCGQQTTTAEPRPPTPTHPCWAHRGLCMPYGRVRADGRIEINRNTPTHQYLRRGGVESLLEREVTPDGHRSRRSYR